jgi:hypothetical protein
MTTVNEVSTPEGGIMICGRSDTDLTHLRVIDYDGGEAFINLSRHHLIELADHIQNRIREIDNER